MISLNDVFRQENMVEFSPIRRKRGVSKMYVNNCLEMEQPSDRGHQNNNSMHYKI